MALARIKWMNTSAVSIRARNAHAPASVCRSSTTLRLPRLTLTKTPLMPGAGPTDMYRVLSPCGGSTLITSAPISAMICVQYGPITIAVRSITRTPANGPVGLAIQRFLVVCAVSPLEAVVDVLVVSVGDARENEWRRHVSDLIQVAADILDRPRRPVHASALGDDRARHP